MTIMWNLILGTEDIKSALENMYKEVGISALAERLGVSRNALLRQMRKYKIEAHPAGGSHTPRYPREDLPPEWWKLTANELAELTGYSRNYTSKLIRRKRCDLAKSTATPTRESILNSPGSISSSDK